MHASLAMSSDVQGLRSTRSSRQNPASKPGKTGKVPALPASRDTSTSSLASRPISSWRGYCGRRVGWTRKSDKIEFRTVAQQLPQARRLGGRQGQQRAKDGRRIKDGKFLARGEESGRFVECFSVFDFGARNREMRIDLATIPRFWTG
jgi:hypothetical protein